MGTLSRSNWNLECWSLRRGENRSTRRKTSRSKERTNNKLNPHMTLGPRIEPGPHWWEASALTTTPPQLPYSLSVSRWSHFLMLIKVTPSWDKWKVKVIVIVIVYSITSSWSELFRDKEKTYINVSINTKEIYYRYYNHLQYKWYNQAFLKLTTNVNNEIANMFTGRVSLKHVYSKHVLVLMWTQHKSSAELNNLGKPKIKFDVWTGPYLLSVIRSKEMQITGEILRFHANKKGIFGTQWMFLFEEKKKKKLFLPIKLVIPEPVGPIKAMRTKSISPTSRSRKLSFLILGHFWKS